MGRLLFQNDVTTERLEKVLNENSLDLLFLDLVWNELIQNSQMDYDAAIQEFIDILGKEPKALTLFAWATSILTLETLEISSIVSKSWSSKDVAFTLLSHFPFLYVLTRRTDSLVSMQPK